LATSLSTVYLSWDLNTTWTQSTIHNTVIVAHDTASYWLQMLEPIQIGYGAVIISFLGAIHWGLELAEKQPSPTRTRFRYTLGVAAPIVAWPSVFMPLEWALTTQFLAFTGLYLADSRATQRGWAPAWYSTYRFVLTAIVGASIFVSLIGRAKVGDKGSRLSSKELTDQLTQPNPQPYRNWEKEEEEEKQRLKKEKEEKVKKEKEEEEKKRAEGKKDLPKGGSKSGGQNNKPDKSKGESNPKESDQPQAGGKPEGGDTASKRGDSKATKGKDSEDGDN